MRWLVYLSKSTAPGANQGLLRPEQQYKVWTVGRDVTETFPETQKPALA